MLVSGREGTGKSRDEFKATAEVLNQVGEICQERGLTFTYHNHWYEIVNDAEELHALCDLTDPNLVSFCLDIGWVERANASVVDVTTEFLERIAYFHLKDTKDDLWMEVGQGTVDFPGLFQVIEGRAWPWSVVEQDETQRTPLESARLSREYLEQQGV